jgi:hypothetical protein
MYIYEYVCINAAVSNRKRKTEKGSRGLIRFPFAQRAKTEVCRLSVCLQRKQTEVLPCKRTKRTKWTKRLTHLICDI